MRESDVLANPPWQYFSKYRKKWVDAHTGDRKDELIKYGYRVRPTPRALDGAKAPRKSKRSTGSPRK
jgi:hypothetical protein